MPSQKAHKHSGPRFENYIIANSLRCPDIDEKITLFNN
jgi:hypothetical protein